MIGPRPAHRSLTLLVAGEAHLVRGTDERIHSASGIEAYPFWTRYLEVFERVVVAARTADDKADGFAPVDGPGVEVLPLPDYRGPWGYLRARPRLERALAAGVARADAICLRAPGPIAALACRLSGERPFGVEVVGDPLDSLSRGAVQSVLRPAARALLARALRRMCRQAVAAAYVTDSALQRRYPPGGWTTSYSSIELEDDAFVAEAELVQRRATAADDHTGTPARPWRLVFVGSLAQLYKGPDVLIDALALCRARGIEMTLTIVGDGAHRPALEARARARGVGAAVRWAGQLRPGAAVRQALDTADLFALPSRQEGLPRALIEAMARGVPSVATRVGGIPELLPGERLVPPGDARALAQAIGRLCAAPKQLVAIGRRDFAVARHYGAGVLRPRRRAFYERLRAAAEGQ